LNLLCIHKAKFGDQQRDGKVSPHTTSSIVHQLNAKAHIQDKKTSWKITEEILCSRKLSSEGTRHEQLLTKNKGLEQHKYFTPCFNHWQCPRSTSHW